MIISVEDADTFKITLPRFILSINGESNTIVFPFSHIIKNHIFMKGPEIYSDVTLNEEYISIIEEKLQNEWFNLDGNNFYRSSCVFKITKDKNVEVIISDLQWEKMENGEKCLRNYSFEKIKEIDLSKDDETRITCKLDLLLENFKKK